MVFACDELFESKKSYIQFYITSKVDDKAVEFVVLHFQLEAN